MKRLSKSQQAALIKVRDRSKKDGLPNKRVGFRAQTLATARSLEKLGLLAGGPVTFSITDAGRDALRWYKKDADQHAMGDFDCKRDWVCACGACQAARADGYTPWVTETDRAFKKLEATQKRLDIVRGIKAIDTEGK